MIHLWFRCENSIYIRFVHKFTFLDDFGLDEFFLRGRDIQNWIQLELWIQSDNPFTNYQANSSIWPPLTFDLHTWPLTPKLYWDPCKTSDIQVWLQMGLRFIGSNHPLMYKLAGKFQHLTSFDLRPTYMTLTPNIIKVSVRHRLSKFGYKRTNGCKVIQLSFA